MISKDSTMTLGDKPKILLINPFGIGDVLFTTPVIKALKDNFPRCIAGYWCNRRVMPILKDNPYIDKIFALSRGDLKKIYRQSWLKGINKALGLFFNLRKENFDISLDFSLDHRYSLVSKLAGVKERIGFDYKNRGRFLTKKISINGYKNKHVTEFYSELLGFLGIKPEVRRLQLFVNKQAEERIGNLYRRLGINQGDLIVGIAPGGGLSWGKDAYLKHWPQEKFAYLADKIINQFKAKVIILGDTQERPIADAVMNTMANQAIDLSGRTDLEELSAIIKSLALLITNDGGVLHMAVAEGTKTVSFFGPVDDLVYGPYPPDKNRHIVFKTGLACRPCYREFRLNTCQNDKKCLKSIDVEQVFEAVSKLMVSS